MMDNNSHVIPQYTFEDNGDTMLDTKETTQNDGDFMTKNYYREALEKQSLEQDTEDAQHDANMFSNNSIRLPRYNEVDEFEDKENMAVNIECHPQEPLPTAHFGQDKSSKFGKKKSKKFKVGESAPKKQYHYLKRLKMKLIDRKENKYHNNVSDKIRRNERWTDSIVLKQKVIFDLGSMAMLSKIHFYNMKVACINVYLAETRKGPFIKVCDKVTLPHGLERVIKVGGLPCRYMMLEMEKGAPLRDAYKNIELYGIYYKEMDNTLGDGFSDILFNNAYEIIYNTKNLAK